MNNYLAQLKAKIEMGQENRLSHFAMPIREFQKFVAAFEHLKIGLEYALTNDEWDRGQICQKHLDMATKIVREIRIS